MHSTFTLFVLSGFTGVLAAPMPQSGSGGSLQGQSCPTDNAIVCDPSGYSFYKCNWGKLQYNGPVSAGTVCKDGQIVADTGNTGGSNTGGDNGGSAPVAPPPSSGNTGGSSDAPVDNGNGGNGGSDNAGGSPPPPPPEQTTTIAVTSQVHVTVSVPVATATASPNAPAVTPKPSPPPSSGGGSDNGSDSGSDNGSSGDASGDSQNVNIPPPVSNPPPSSGGSKVGSGSSSLSEAQVLAAAPSSNTCSGGNADECRTASQAAPFIAASFDKYGVTTNNEKAALLSLMAFESGDFKYNINHFPGRPGQGTRNMMMPNFIAMYAQTVAANKMPAGVTKDNIDSQSDSVKNQVRSLVLGDDFSFASAAWFYSTQCSDSVKSGLKTGGEQGWETYISSCVGTTVTDDRKTKYQAALKALGN